MLVLMKLFGFFVSPKFGLHKRVIWKLLKQIMATLRIWSSSHLFHAEQEAYLMDFFWLPPPLWRHLECGYGMVNKHDDVGMGWLTSMMMWVWDG